MINTKEAPVKQATPHTIVEDWCVEIIQKTPETDDYVMKEFPDFIQEQFRAAVANPKPMEDWLNAKLASEYAGEKEDAERCPLANFMLAYFAGKAWDGGYLTFAVDDQSIEVCFGTKMTYYSCDFESPAWAKRFVCHVDGHHSIIVDVEEARKSMAFAIREK